MKPFSILMFLGLSAGLAGAQETNEAQPPLPEEIILAGEAAALEDFVWLKRPIVVFADSPNDPRFIEQMDLLTDGLGDLAERDVVVLTDTDPSTRSALREKLHPRGFMLVLIGKDGTVKLRKPLPWDTRELSRTIDKMPMRQREMRDRPGRS
jgi:hypothetical protein